MKFIVLFFTLSGIYTLHAQEPAVADTIDNSGKTLPPVKQVQPDSADNFKPSLSFFPNPAKNKVSIVITNFNAGYVQVFLLDNAGNIKREERRLVLGSKEIIVFMFSQCPGLYHLIVRQEGIVLKSQLIIK